MASTFTAYLNLEKQGAGDNSGTWGTVLNANYDILDNVASGATAITPDINGGTIDGAVIGGASSAAGTFTTITTGDVNIQATGAPELSIQDTDGTNQLVYLQNSAGSALIDARNNTADGQILFRGRGAGTPNEYARFDELGNFGFAGTHVVSLDVSAKTDAVALPSGTTAQRPTGVAGYFRYNSTDDSFEGYTTADGWGAVGGGGGGYFKGENGAVGDATTGPGDIFRINEQELNTSTTIGATENASCAGPLAVASGVTLTVTSGGNLVIL